MKDDNSLANGGEPPADHRLQSLKGFHSAGRGFWRDVPDADWNDWHWQLKHRITTPEQLQRFMPTLAPEEFAGAKLANHKLALAITPYFFNLIDPLDEHCPIRQQVIPRIEETHTAPWEMSDPCGEDSHSPVPGLVHRYPTACCSSSPTVAPHIAVTARARGWSATRPVTIFIPNSTGKSPTSRNTRRSATCC